MNIILRKKEGKMVFQIGKHCVKKTRSAIKEFVTDVELCISNLGQKRNTRVIML